MSTITQTISNLSMGDNSISRAINSLMGLNIGSGLFAYTTNLGLRRLNTFNNFNNGKTGSYGYTTSNLIGIAGVKTTHVSFRNYSTVPNDDYIGDGYVVRNTTNAPLKFISTEDFTNLGEYFKNYADAVNTNVFKKLGKTEELETYSKMTHSSGHVFYDYITRKAEERKYQASSGLSDTAKDLISNFYPKYRYTTKRYSDIGVDSAHIINYDGEFGSAYTISINNNEVKANLSSTELYTDSNTFRQKYEDVFSNINYPDYLGQKVHYYWGNQYMQKGNTLDRYSIKDTNNYTGSTLVDTATTKNSIYNKSSYWRTYSFFQESDNSDTNAKFSKTQQTDLSTVSIDDYKNGSRLLQRTNKLFKEHKIGTLVNRFHTDGINKNDSEIITAYDTNFGMSRGRNLVKKSYEGKTSGDKSSGYDNPYCRVWTAHHQYSYLKDRIRPFYTSNGPMTIKETQSKYGNLRPYDGATRLNDNSVLMSNGYLRITPDHDTSIGQSIKNCMFSIENLAWKDIANTNDSLSTEQKGPNGGRIMWFPPYNLSFNENVSVNWNENTFIGRGESIYTYTNTKRSGTLKFSLLIDHPSVIDKYASTATAGKESDLDILRFFAGCDDLNDSLKDDPEPETPTTPIIDPEPTPQTKQIAYVIFFPNDWSGKNYFTKSGINSSGITKICEYENSSSGIWGGADTKDGKERDTIYNEEILAKRNLVNNNVATLNFSNSYESAIRRILSIPSDVEIRRLDKLMDLASDFMKITNSGLYYNVSLSTQGFASSHGYDENNMTELAPNRCKFIEKLAKYKCDRIAATPVTKLSDKQIEIGEPDHGNKADINGINAKISRAAVLYVNISWKDSNTPSGIGTVDNSGNTYLNFSQRTLTNAIKNIGNTHKTSLDDAKQELDKRYDSVNGTLALWNLQSQNMLFVKSVNEQAGYGNTYDNEYQYFKNVRNNKLYYQQLVTKFKYFDPAFHSITPEGFNARLTFLHQCTRQGPTNAVSNGTTNSGSVDYLKYAGNLSFGRAPYCILRIGDFFHTKICIDSMSIDYDNSGGLQWDLNPEGIGVQPMYATINLNFTFLGGQDITGPIERLQNAVTANYYANTSIYDRHSDNESVYYDALKDERVTKE